jgi:long-chain acyl-CoA synthetase
MSGTAAGGEARQLNLARIVEGHDPEAPALISRNRTITYGELVDQAGRLRAGLAHLGLATGDRVALICGNGHPFVIAYLAAVGLGAVVVPLNPTSPAAELEGQLAEVDVVAVVVDRSAAGWHDVDRSRLESIRHVVAVDTAVLDGAILLDDLLTSEALPVANVAPDHLAVLMFTAGTAGAPRAAMLTHGNLLANLEQARSTSRRVGPDDVVFGAVPLYHVFGLNVVLGFSLFVGASVLLVQRFDPTSAVESIRSRGVTVIPGPPAMWVAFAELEDVPADAFAGVRLALSGAAKLPVTVAEQIRDRFGVSIAEGYGLTEASPVVTSSAGLVPRFGSAGKVLVGVELRLVDDDGHDALVGDVGEVWVRGDNVFAGYLDDPDATARVLTPDGWLRTGDLAMCDDEGWLYLVDRAKDLIIVSGFNVYPAEVEEALVQHPAVAEAGVTGVPDRATGEAIVAFVVRQPGAEVGPDELIASARDRLARYKCPSRVVFVDHLPRNSIGKLLRRELVV